MPFYNCSTLSQLKKIVRTPPLEIVSLIKSNQITRSGDGGSRRQQERGRGKRQNQGGSSPMVQRKQKRGLPTQVHQRALMAFGGSSCLDTGVVLDLQWLLPRVPPKDLGNGGDVLDLFNICWSNTSLGRLARPHSTDRLYPGRSSPVNMNQYPW